MPLINVVICEDDDLELERLEKLLEKTGQEIKVFVYRNAEDFLNTFEPQRYDIIFMDIYMPGMTGVEAVEKIRSEDKDVYIAFCTTSRDNAIDGYRLKVERYLEKPVKFEDLLEVLERAASRRMSVKRRCLPIGKSAIVTLEDIVYIEQKNHTVYFHLSNGEILHKTDSLDEIMKMIGETNFCHCHKSYIVNFDYVESIEPKRFAFKMPNDERVQIKQREFPKIRDKFNEYMFSMLRETR